MLSKQKLKQKTQETWEMAGLVSVYQEVAAGKIREMKVSVEQSREYWESLHRTMIAVGEDMVGDGEGSGRAIVWLAAEMGLYGGVVHSSRRKLQEIMNEAGGATVYVAGKRGAQLFREWWPNTSFSELALPDEELIKVELEQVVANLPKYRELVVIYGKMVNLLTQEPRVTRWQIMGNRISDQDKRKYYLYEPNPKIVGDFLGTQVTSGIMTQLAGENKLAKLAARIMSLEETMTEVEKDLSGLKIEMRRAKAREDEKKQQARITRQQVRRTS